jgi:hypothetical protein
VTAALVFAGAVTVDVTYTTERVEAAVVVFASVAAMVVGFAWVDGRHWLYHWFDSTQAAPSTHAVGPARQCLAFDKHRNLMKQLTREPSTTTLGVHGTSRTGDHSGARKSERDGGENHGVESGGLHLGRTQMKVGRRSLGNWERNWD